jgi:hypothetical protein
MTEAGEICSLAVVDLAEYIQITQPLMYWWFQVNMFKDYIPQAFPHGTDLILDSEVLLIDVKSGKPLPFGSLGKHKVIPKSRRMFEQEVPASVAETLATHF